jgi:hypothetical protein
VHYEYEYQIITPQQAEEMERRFEEQASKKKIDDAQVRYFEREAVK